MTSSERKSRRGPFATEIKSLREAKGWSQEDLARQAGVSTSYISKIEQDAVVNMPSKETIRDLADALDADVEELEEKASQCGFFDAGKLQRLSDVRTESGSRYMGPALRMITERDEITDDQAKEIFDNLKRIFGKSQ